MAAACWSCSWVHVLHPLESKTTSLHWPYSSPSLLLLLLGAKVVVPEETLGTSKLLLPAGLALQKGVYFLPPYFRTESTMLLCIFFPHFYIYTRHSWVVRLAFLIPTAIRSQSGNNNGTCFLYILKCLLDFIATRDYICIRLVFFKRSYFVVYFAPTIFLDTFNCNCWNAWMVETLMVRMAVCCARVSHNWPP